MKQLLSTLIIVIYTLSTLTAQTAKLSGTIQNLPDSVARLILLEGDGHYYDPAIISSISNKQFGFEVKTQQPVFALLILSNQEHRLLLSPGKNLTLKLDSSVSHPVFSGQSANENIILSKLGMDEVIFFEKKTDKGIRYDNLSFDSLMSEVYQPALKLVNEKELIIEKSTLPSELKKMLSTETKYWLQCNLYDFSTNRLRWAGNKSRDTFRTLAVNLYPKPLKEVTEPGFYPSMMLGKHIQYDVQNVGKLNRRDTVAMDRLSKRFFGTDFITLRSKVEEFGERYITDWMYAKMHFSKAVQEKILMSKILDAFNTGATSASVKLYDTMRLYFPAGKYLEIAEKRAKIVSEKLAKEIKNSKIRIFESATDTNFTTLLKPFNGRLVYVDIWGTWCGPCKIEMQYVGNLKKRFEDKDVEFVYLDMDEDNQHEQWKEYIRFYGIEGNHFRFNNQNIEPFWKEVGDKGGKTNLYPTYLIFDRNGKMIEAGAERPSSLDKLYTQIEKLL
ncbi:MAG: TlpA disulfide reductase family protein [Flavitalea sp.]